jgi:integrase
MATEARLTDLAIRNAKPRERPYKLYDGKGLFLLVQPNGSRHWRLRFHLDGKENLYALGRYGDEGLSLAAARDEARKARALVKRGISPILARQQENQANLEAGRAAKREQAGSFAKVASAWLAEGKRQWAQAVWESRQRRIDKYLLPAFGTRPIGSITGREIRPILERCRRFGEWTAIRVKSDLNGLFKFANCKDLVEGYNPIIGLAGLIRVPVPEHKAVLTPAHIRQFNDRLRAYRGYPETAHALRLLALTATRPSETAQAEWSEIDVETALWRIPAARMKSRVEHWVPLSPAALAVLEDLRPITGDSRYLFPHRNDRARPGGQPRLAQAMRAMALGPGTSPHCWRTTFSTWANGRGFKPDAIERQLAHGERNAVRAAYNMALLLPERREMLNAWANYLAGTETAQVVPFRRTRPER